MDNKAACWFWYVFFCGFNLLGFLQIQTPEPSFSNIVNIYLGEKKKGAIINLRKLSKP